MGVLRTREHVCMCLHRHMRVHWCVCMYICVCLYVYGEGGRRPLGDDEMRSCGGNGDGVESLCR